MKSNCNYANEYFPIWMFHIFSLVMLNASRAAASRNAIMDLQTKNFYDAIFRGRGQMPRKQKP